MTKREKTNVEAAIKSIRELLTHANGLPFELQPTDVMVRAHAAVRVLETAEPPKTKGDTVWPSTAFWTAAYMVLAFTSNEWGHNPRPGTKWERGRLRLTATGGDQTRY